MVDRVESAIASPLPSNRSFGLLFIAILGVAACYSLYNSLPTPITAALGIATVLLSILTAASPERLSPLNRAWFALGLFLGKLVNPIVLGAIFFLMLTPIAVLTRFRGRDELKLKKRSTASYWVKRDPAGPEPESFKNQF